MKSEREEVSGTYVRLYEKQTLARAVFVLVSLSIGRQKDRLGGGRGSGQREWKDHTEVHNADPESELHMFKRSQNLINGMPKFSKPVAGDCIGLPGFFSLRFWVSSNRDYF